MKTALKTILLTLILVLSASFAYANDFEMSSADQDEAPSGNLVYDDGAVEIYELPFDVPAALKSKAVSTTDPVITWLAFPLVSNQISNGFKLGTTINHTVWTYSSKSGPAKVVFKVTDLIKGTKVSKTVNLTMTAGKAYTVTYGYKPTLPDIFFCEANVLFTGITAASALNSAYFKYFISK